MTYRSGSFSGYANKPHELGIWRRCGSALTTLEPAKEDESRPTRPMYRNTSLAVHHRRVGDLDKQISLSHDTLRFQTCRIWEGHVSIMSCCTQLDFPLTLTGSDPTAKCAVLVERTSRSDFFVDCLGRVVVSSVYANADSNNSPWIPWIYHEIISIRGSR
jgi:hypothetical protein